MTDKKRKEIEEMTKVAIENDPIICVQCKDKGTDKCNTANCVRNIFFQNATENLHKAGYRKQTDVAREFAERATARIFESITQRFCDCYNDGLHREYPDRELSRNVLMAFDECKDIAKREINDLAAQYGKEE